MNTERTKVVEEVKKFGQETTIHGASFLASNKLHFLERLFWMVIITTAIIFSISLCLSTWNRYFANPTVVSLQKDFRNWNNPFPAATVCFFRKTDDVLAAEYIESTWQINFTHPQYEYYVEFVKAVTNISYQTLDALRKFGNDSTLDNVDMMDLAIKVHPNSENTLITFDANEKAKWTKIMTEMGICITMNAIFSNILAFRDEDKKIDPTTREVLRCHFLNGPCYARFDSDPDAPVRFYIHSYLDISHATASPPWNGRENQDIELNYRMQETTADTNLKSLNPVQRGCRFEYEPISNDVPYYSTTICYMLCRYRIVKKLCGCRPFFYHNLGGKLCNLKGLICVADHSQYLLQPPSKLGCDCPQPCNTITYLPQIPKITLWEYGYFEQRITFRWDLVPPTTKFHRSILFGFEDLVVSFGGIAALFLGISFVSVIEALFFFFRIVFYCCKWLILKKAP